MKIELIEDQEFNQIEKEEFSFLERQNLAERRLKQVQDSIENREIIYRAVYKQCQNPKNLDRFLDKKGEELERENRISRANLQQSINAMEGEMKELDKTMHLNA